MSKDELFDDVYVVLGQMHHRSDKTNKHIKMICLEGMQNLSRVHVGMSMGRIGGGGYFPDPRPAGESIPRPRPRSPLRGNIFLDPRPRSSPRSPTVFFCLLI